MGLGILAEKLNLIHQRTFAVMKGSCVQGRTSRSVVSKSHFFPFTEDLSTWRMEILRGLGLFSLKNRGAAGGGDTLLLPSTT